MPLSTPPAPPPAGGCTPVSVQDGEDAGGDSTAGGEAGGGEEDDGGAVGVLSSGGGFPPDPPSDPGDASSGDGSAASPPKPVPGNPVVASAAAAASRDPSGFTRDFAGSTFVPASAVGSLRSPVLPFGGSVAARGDVGSSVRTITSSAPLPGTRKSFALSFGLQPMSAPMSAPITTAPVSVAAMRRKAWPRPANPLGRRGRARSLPRNPPAERALAVASASRRRSSSATCARVRSRSHRTAGAVGSGRERRGRARSHRTAGAVGSGRERRGRARSHRTAGAVGSGRERWFLIHASNARSPMRQVPRTFAPASRPWSRARCKVGSSIRRRRATSAAVRKRCWFLFVLLP
jgi:hypothetical protein